MTYHWFKDFGVNSTLCLKECGTHRTQVPGIWNISYYHAKNHWIYSVSQKIPPVACGFLTFFHKRLKILIIFTRLLYVSIYTRLQIFIQLSPTLTKLCHIKRDCLVHITCSKCPPSTERNTHFAKVFIIALLIVVCGKSSQICCFYNVNKHVRYDMTSTVMSFAQ